MFWSPPGGYLFCWIWSELWKDEASIHGLYLQHSLPCLSNLIPLCLNYLMQNKRKYVFNPLWGVLALYMTMPIFLLSIFCFESPQWSLRKLSAIAVPIDIHQRVVLSLLWVMCKPSSLHAWIKEKYFAFFVVVRIPLTVSSSKQFQSGCLCQNFSDIEHLLDIRLLFWQLTWCISFCAH